MVTRVLWQFGITEFARRILTSRGRFVLTFHGVSRHKHSELPVDVQPYLCVDEFKEVLDWLAKRFAFLTPNDFLYTGKAGVLLTFDDGLANNYTNVLPVLREYNAPAVFFVTTQHVIAPQDWLPATLRVFGSFWNTKDDIPKAIAEDFYDGLSCEQLAIMARDSLVTIGSHTVTHPFLTQCTQEQLFFELTESRKLLVNICNQPVDLFAYPTGEYDLRVMEAVRETGYHAAFAVIPRHIGLPCYEIPRIDLYSSQPAYLGMKLSGIYHPALRRALLENGKI
jgi:peptidoglycan/xylan/chitin deacetylase (PgdA/CDA1 family)